MISGISHITYIVENLDKATTFFQEIFGAKEVYYSGEKKFSISREKFFMINNLWIAVMEGKQIEKSYNHFVFKIDESDYEMYLEKIEKLGLEIKSGRKRITGEGRSIYFYDYDNHLFELHTGTLESRLLRYQKQYK
ncbi:FosX/FosE/FosI family fosfomycin resistance hydrolase [Clostridium tepidum]|uniref:FosX/FosE/FosI family fosfomycin resistance hydrolase n=1 Tax=Clostridium tepidum TaxID=1962263 RepID=UPI0018A9913B|nr:FosX/FosE/FosI family fosfomycin resistance hydrolase [Clostridium tepidum]